MKRAIDVVENFINLLKSRHQHGSQHWALRKINPVHSWNDNEKIDYSRTQYYRKHDFFFFLS